MQLPSQLLKSIQDITGFDKEAFQRIHASGEQVTSIRLNPAKPTVQFPNFPIPDSKIPWTDFGYYLESRPSFTFDPLFHAGCYYVQEASSMFLEQALKQTVDLSKPLKVLDLCAAPGGKSTHIQSLISKESLLVSNEVIRSRANVLKENIIKWGCQNVVVTNNDPKDIARLENYFDVIVVDAPCSGSGLFRRDPEAINEWSENNVQLCSQRQQRILADAWPALKRGGILIYSTCSYSQQEDEDIMDWVSSELQTINCKLVISEEWGIAETISGSGNSGYRFWPYKIKGEGFFLTCFKKKDEEDMSAGKMKNPVTTLNNKETAIVADWINTSGLYLLKHETTVYAWPEKMKNDFSFILDKVRVIYSGTEVGTLMKEKLIPSHALAMTKLVNDVIPKLELTRDDAIQYLKKKDIKTEMSKKGWQLVSYQRYSLGWVNILSGRINNYYPKELRILKDN